MTSKYALGTSLLLASSCALIDPIDVSPTAHGAASSAGFGSTIAGAMNGSSGSGVAGTASNAGGSSGKTSDEVPCVVNADCESKSRCLPTGVCASLITDTTGPCPKLIGGEFASDPNAIFFGAFAPLDQDSVEAQTISAIYEMAAEEFNALGGLRGASGGRPSPLVVTVCNNSEASTPQALSHLINDVQVPALLAAMDANQLLAGFNAYPDTFFVSAFNGSRELADVSGGRLWTMLGRPADYADIYAALMPHVEESVHADLIQNGNDRKLRVATVIEVESAFELELSRAVLSRITVNGSSLADQPSNYLGTQVATDGSNVVQVVQSLYEFSPDIVFSFAGNLFTAGHGVMNRLDQEYWPDQRPFYVLSPENAQAGADVSAELTRLRKADKDNVHRVLGVASAGLPPGMTDALNAFKLNLLAKYPDARTDFGNYYDAFYYLVDAMYASPRQAFRDGTLSAGDLARGMRRLTNLSKAKIDVGPNGISDIFSTLNSSDSETQLYGTMGAPDFDRTTGMRRESGSVFCFDSPRLNIQNDVIAYHRDTDRLQQVEHPPCLVGFLSP